MVEGEGRSSGEEMAGAQNPKKPSSLRERRLGQAKGVAAGVIDSEIAAHCGKPVTG